MLTLSGVVGSLERRSWAREGRSGVKSTLHVFVQGSAPVSVTVPEGLLEQSPELLQSLTFGAPVVVGVDVRLRQYDGKAAYVELVSQSVAVSDS